MGGRIIDLRKTLDVRTDALEVAISVLEGLAKDTHAAEWLDDDEWHSCPSTLTRLRAAWLCDANGRSMIHHARHPDGTLRAAHCCGCFNFDEDLKVARCNECGEEQPAHKVLRQACRDIAEAPASRSAAAEERGA